MITINKAHLNEHISVHFFNGTQIRSTESVGSFLMRCQKYERKGMYDSLFDMWYLLKGADTVFFGDKQGNFLKNSWITRNRTYYVFRHNEALITLDEYNGQVEKKYYHPVECRNYFGSKDSLLTFKSQGIRLYNLKSGFRAPNGITAIPIYAPPECRFGYLYYTNFYGAFEFFPVFCIAKKFRNKKSGRCFELFEIENTDTQEVVWELGIPMESLQRSLLNEDNLALDFNPYQELLRSYVVYLALSPHTYFREAFTHWHRVAITSKNVQPDIHKTYVKVEVTAISEVLCPTIKPNAYDE